MKARTPLPAVLLAGLLLLAGCREMEPAGLATVTFSLQEEGPAGTRAGSSGESEVRRWALLLFRDGLFADYSLSSSPEPITRTLQTGSYTAYAVANYPEASFHPERFREAKDLTEDTVDLFDNAFDAPVMFGRTDLDLPEGSGFRGITVERLVCKAGVRKVSVDFADPTLAGKPFVLKGIFLSNCCRQARYGSDLSREELSRDATGWYNPMGRNLSENRLLTASGLEISITPHAPYGVPHSFLYYPNPTDSGSDTHAAAWSPRCTRMVLEAQVGDRTCYYPVTLPPVARNRTCIADEIIIRRAGSPDPEQEVPEAIEIRFSPTVEPWEQQYHDKDAL